ncbi:MAG: IS5 family transposase [Gammaproteobacteria bacterium]|nr:IS5 family transposase [Gammaproteobacteria bacterium]
MQPGFFDLDNRYQELEKLGDPLPTIERVVDWESFRPMLEKIHQKTRKSNAGRKPYDVVLMFKVLVLQHLYNLADEQTEYQIQDRYSFCRFLGLTPEGRVPDARTIWLFRERLKELELVETLFAQLSKQIEGSGYIARRGQIVDASIVAAPRQRNRREENALVKEGKTPEAWQDKPAKLRQKDVEARWTKKHGKTYYGYKNHVGIDNEHKLVRRFGVTDAAVHDSQVLDRLLDPMNTSADVWADSAYRSKEREAALKERGYRSHIQTKGTAKRPLSERAIKANHRRAKVRVRVEHIFAAQTAMGGMLVRTIGLARARVKIGMMNIVYNIRRLAYLETRRALSSP